MARPAADPAAPVRVAIVTVSDRASAGAQEDLTGPALASAVQETGHVVAHARVVPDGAEAVAGAVADLVGAHEVVLLAGGTGIGPRDRTPEGLAAACDLLVPGIGEAIRAASRAAVPTADLSRACAGVRGECLVIAVPGSPRGAVEAWGAIAHLVPHAVAIARGGVHGA